MTSAFRELVIGGVLLAPFIAYAVASLIIVLLIRPILHFSGFAKMFSHQSIAELSLYVALLGVLIVFF